MNCGIKSIAAVAPAMMLVFSFFVLLITICVPFGGSCIYKYSIYFISQFEASFVFVNMKRDIALAWLALIALHYFMHRQRHCITHKHEAKRRYEIFHTKWPAFGRCNDHLAHLVSHRHHAQCNHRPSAFVIRFENAFVVGGHLFPYFVLFSLRLSMRCGNCSISFIVTVCSGSCLHNRLAVRHDDATQQYRGMKEKKWEKFH